MFDADDTFENALISIEMNEDRYAENDVCLIKCETDTIHFYDLIRGLQSQHHHSLNTFLRFIIVFQKGAGLTPNDLACPLRTFERFFMFFMNPRSLFETDRSS